MPDIGKERERLPIDKVPGDIVNVIVVQIDSADGVREKFVLILRADLSDETDQIGVLRFFGGVRAQLRQETVEGIAVVGVDTGRNIGQPINEIGVGGESGSIKKIVDAVEML